MVNCENDINLYSRSEDSNLTLATANAAFIQEDFNVLQDYKENLVQNFHSEIKSVDFINKELASDTINSWVKGQTNDKIQDLLNPKMITDLTRLILGKRAFNFCYYCY